MTSRLVRPPSAVSRATPETTDPLNTALYQMLPNFSADVRQIIAAYSGEIKAYSREDLSQESWDGTRHKAIAQLIAGSFVFAPMQSRIGFDGRLFLNDKPVAAGAFAEYKSLRNFDLSCGIAAMFFVDSALRYATSTTYESFLAKSQLDCLAIKANADSAIISAVIRSDLVFLNDGSKICYSRNGFPLSALITVKGIPREGERDLLFQELSISAPNAKVLEVFVAMLHGKLLLKEVDLARLGVSEGQLRLASIKLAERELARLAARISEDQKESVLIQLDMQSPRGEQRQKISTVEEKSARLKINEGKIKALQEQRAQIEMKFKASSGELAAAGRQFYDASRKIMTIRQNIQSMEENYQGHKDEILLLENLAKQMELVKNTEEIGKIKLQIDEHDAAMTKMDEEFSQLESQEAAWIKESKAIEARMHLLRESIYRLEQQFQHYNEKIEELQNPIEAATLRGSILAAKEEARCYRETIAEQREALRRCSALTLFAGANETVPPASRHRRSASEADVKTAIAPKVLVAAAPRTAAGGHSRSHSISNANNNPMAAFLSSLSRSASSSTLSSGSAQILRPPNPRALHPTGFLLLPSLAELQSPTNTPRGNSNQGGESISDEKAKGVAILRGGTT